MPIDAIVVDYRADRLDLAVASLHAIRQVDLIHVVDNSGDTQWAAVTEAAGGKICAHKYLTNNGFGSAVNRAAHCSSASHLLVSNPDAQIDYWDLSEDVSERSDARYWISAPNIITQAGDAEASWGEFQSIQSLVLSLFGASKVKRAELVSESVACDWVSGASFLADARVFTELGGFDPRFFLYYEDMDLCWRVHQAGGIVVKTNWGLVTHQGGGTMTSSVRRRIHIYRGLARFLSTRYYSTWHSTPDIGVH